MPVVDKEMATRFVKALIAAREAGKVQVTGKERFFLERFWRFEGRLSENQVWQVIDMMQAYSSVIGFDFEGSGGGAQREPVNAGNCRQKGAA